MCITHTRTAWHRVPVKPFSRRAMQVRCTCSIQGEYEHRRPPIRSDAAAWDTASHGDGRSRNTASAVLLRSLPKPLHASPCVHVTS